MLLTQKMLSMAESALSLVNSDSLILQIMEEHAPQQHTWFKYAGPPVWKGKIVVGGVSLPISTVRPNTHPELFTEQTCFRCQSCSGWAMCPDDDTWPCDTFVLICQYLGLEPSDAYAEA